MDVQGDVSLHSTDQLLQRCDLRPVCWMLTIEPLLAGISGWSVFGRTVVIDWRYTASRVVRDEVV